MRRANRTQEGIDRDQFASETHAGSPVGHEHVLSMAHSHGITWSRIREPDLAKPGGPFTPSFLDLLIPYGSNAGFS